MVNTTMKSKKVSMIIMLKGLKYNFCHQNGVETLFKKSEMLFHLDVDWHTYISI